MGVLLYELAHKRAPFMNNQFARKQTVSNTVLMRTSLNKGLRSINKLCLKKNPIDRPTSEELL